MSEASEASEAGPLTFPYISMAAAYKDKYAELGGPDKAFSLLIKGYKSVVWRRRHEQRVKEQEAANDAAVKAAEQKAQKVQSVKAHAQR
jgi:hypothetical protein